MPISRAIAAAVSAKSPVTAKTYKDLQVSRTLGKGSNKVKVSLTDP